MSARIRIQRLCNTTMYCPCPPGGRDAHAALVCGQIMRALSQPSSESFGGILLGPTVRAHLPPTPIWLFPATGAITVGVTPCSRSACCFLCLWLDSRSIPLSTKAWPKRRWYQSPGHRAALWSGPWDRLAPAGCGGAPGRGAPPTLCTIHRGSLIHLGTARESILLILSPIRDEIGVTVLATADRRRSHRLVALCHVLGWKVQYHGTCGDYAGGGGGMCDPDRGGGLVARPRPASGLVRHWPGQVVYGLITIIVLAQHAEAIGMHAIFGGIFCRSWHKGR